MIRNPILPGFNPDPAIVRRGDDYYIATSTFEWFPGIAVYHSRDLKNWRLLTHVLNDEASLDLRKLPSAKGIWAPCLTWCEADGLFYVLYTKMISHNARFFDQDNFLVSAPEITGPWSEPVYLNSIGFDPSFFHDDDGKKYVVALEWEFRDGYEKPGVIAIQEYDLVTKSVAGYAERIWRGGTDRGCIEAPHIYKHDGR
jgi:xylan 1,4-beta-xylosidase